MEEGVGGRTSAPSREGTASQSQPRLKLPGKWCPGLPASLLPPCRLQLRRETPRHPFLALGVRLHEATGRTGGIGGTRPGPSSGASSGPLYKRFGFGLRLYTPTPASWALTPSCRSYVDRMSRSFFAWVGSWGCGRLCRLPPLVP